MLELVMQRAFIYLEAVVFWDNVISILSAGQNWDESAETLGKSSSFGTLRIVLSVKDRARSHASDNRNQLESAEKEHIGTCEQSRAGIFK